MHGAGTESGIGIFVQTCDSGIIWEGSSHSIFGDSTDVGTLVLLPSKTKEHSVSKDEKIIRLTVFVKLGNRFATNKVELYNGTALPLDVSDKIDGW